MLDRRLIVVAALLSKASASKPIPGYESATLKHTSSVPADLEWSQAWLAADWAAAASVLATAGLLDTAVLYLRKAAGIETMSGDISNRWLAFGRALVALASADPPFPMAQDHWLLEELASSALASATRAYGGRCEPSDELKKLETTSTPPHTHLQALRASELHACKATKALARDVLAELVIHCDNNEGSLWDRCPEEYIAPLRTAELPPWPEAVRPPTADDGRVACDIPRRQWPELSAAAFEREYNAPQQPVIVSGLTENWPAAHWANAEGSEDFMFLRMGQSLMRSLMRRAHGQPPYVANAPRPNPAALFGVSPFANGEHNDNQYINLDDTNLAYRHPLMVGLPCLAPCTALPFWAHPRGQCVCGPSTRCTH